MEGDMSRIHLLVVLVLVSVVAVASAATPPVQWGPWNFGTLMPPAASDQLPAQSTLSLVQPSATATGCPGVRLSSAPPFDYVSCFKPRPNSEVWTINRPNVSQPTTHYPSIKFERGDLVSFAAGGCADRGGARLSTYRYVEPLHSNSNLWYGSVSIAGVMGPTRLRDILQSGPIEIQSGDLPALQLHYADNQYNDNSYNLDDGYLEECRQMDDAWVVVIIQHKCAGLRNPQ